MIENEAINSIITTLSYANKFYGNVFLIKLGGSILDNEAMMKSLCNDLKLLICVGIKIIIVHGGSKAINKYLAINNINSDFVDGLRVTSVEAMKIIEMVLCGHVNKMLVRNLNSIGINAIGLAGSDNNMLQCEYYSEQHGCVGKIKSVNTDFLSQLISSQKSTNLIPVIAPVGVDAAGNSLNINADSAASYIATALGVDKLIFLTDQNGIYDKDGKLYSELTDGELLNLIANKTVQGGMLIKTKAILAALAQRLNHIHILNGNRQHALIEELFTIHGIGTVCKSSHNSTQIEDGNT